MPRYRIRRRIYYYDVLETVDVPSREDAIDAVERGDYTTVEEETYDYTSDVEDWNIDEVIPTPPRPAGRFTRMAVDAASAIPVTPADLNDIVQAIRREGFAPVPRPTGPPPIDDSVEDVQFEEE